MFKVYKRVEDALHYREAWINEGTLTEHSGTVGERGKSREKKLSKNADAEQALLALLHAALDDGYDEIAAEDHATLMIEYRIDGFGSEQDLKKRHALEDRLSETLGWTGLGQCDGGSSGSGTMEVCCFVVDYELAKRAIASDLANTKFGDYCRIYREE